MVEMIRPFEVARFYDPTTGSFTSRDPANATTRSAYGYVGNSPLNATDPSGMCVGPDWVCGVINTGVTVMTGGQSNCAKFGPDDPYCEATLTQAAEEHPGAAQAANSYAGGALKLNPITAATNGAGVTDTDSYVDTSSWWYFGGEMSMLAVDFFGGLGVGSSGPGGCTWAASEEAAASAEWAMTGSPNALNWLKTGRFMRYPFSNGFPVTSELTTEGVNWFKVLLGQRRIVP